MAKINIKEMERLNKSTNHIHSEVTATYSVFVKDGKKYFQIDTYGSNSRKLVDKASQAIQIDRDDAIELINLLKREYGL